MKFGGTAATNVVVVSSTSITATTPAHASGAVSVVVTNTDAQAGTLNNGYTYTATNPAPTITSITPNTGTANGGTPVTIAGTGFLAGATVSFGGTAATNVVVVKQRFDHRDYSRTRRRCSECSRHQHGQPKRHFDQWLHLHFQQRWRTNRVCTSERRHPADGTGASVTVAYPLAQTAGNLNIVVVGWNDNTSTLNSVSDSNENSYIQAGTTIAGTGIRQAIFYAKNIAAGSNTVTVSLNQAAAYVDVRILEYSGLDTANPLDVTAGAAGASAAPNSGAATTTSANELIFGAGTTGGLFSARGYWPG